MTTQATQFAGHTPGPWNWHGPYMTGGYKVSALDEHEILSFRCYVEPSEAVLANARLIAAAPELLAERDALRERVAQLEAALRPHIDIDKRKLAALEKRPYAIGIVTVRERLAASIAALAGGRP